MEEPIKKVDKSLKSKAVSIKGKSYVLVSDRVLFFNSEYLDGSITVELLTPPEKAGTKGEVIVVKATVIPDCSQPDRRFVDYSQAVIGSGMVNMTAALENASTSAVGRALAYMGIGVIDGIASIDEINKAKAVVLEPPKYTSTPKTYPVKKPVGAAWVAPQAMEPTMPGVTKIDEPPF